MSSDITVAGLKLARRLLNRKFRGAAGEFLVEGAQCVSEALSASAAKKVLATPQAAKQFPDLVRGGYTRVTPQQVEELSDTVTPQGIFAICTTPTWSFDDVFTSQARLVVICSQIRDPGNLGTVIRCADAFGADGVILSPGSVDYTNPKTVRASVGSIFHLPVVADADLKQTLAAAHAQGFSILAADGTGEDLNDLAASGVLNSKIGWILGNEAWGLPHELALADKVVRIPMWGQAESLNLSTAAAICLFATASAQRR
ncbi:MAG: RNA methyltransferase [Propionibacteriaceae bacterium]|nr:RNA methyltransferase [Propionibacteriaceae bacterium]